MKNIYLNSEEKDRLKKIINFLTKERPFISVSELKEKIFFNDSEILFMRVWISLFSIKKIKQNMNYFVDVIRFNKRTDELVYDEEDIIKLSEEEKEDLETIVFLKPNKFKEYKNSLLKKSGFKLFDEIYQYYHNFYMINETIDFIDNNESIEIVGNIPEIPEMEKNLEIILGKNEDIPEKYRVEVDFELLEDFKNDKVCYMCGVSPMNDPIIIRDVGTYDSPIDGNDFEIVICRDCLLKTLKNAVWVGKDYDGRYLDKELSNEPLSKAIYVNLKKKILEKPFGTNFKTDLEEYIKMICYYDKYFYVDTLYWLIGRVLLSNVFDIDIDELDREEQIKIWSKINELLDKYCSDDFNETRGFYSSVRNDDDYDEIE